MAAALARSWSGQPTRWANSDPSSKPRVPRAWRTQLQRWPSLSRARIQWEAAACSSRASNSARVSGVGRISRPSCCKARGQGIAKLEAAAAAAATEVIPGITVTGQAGWPSATASKT